jgi:hypothetical protein
MIPTSHRTRFHAGHPSAGRATPFPAYLVRDSDHVPDIEMMMERHRVLKMGDDVAWLEHMTIQRTVPGFLLYAKLSDARQMAHHPEYKEWVRRALPLDEALGSGWRLISESDVHEMLGDAPAE